MNRLPAADNTREVQRFACFQLDPIQDPRWAELVSKHPKASVFHTVEWLQALRSTYGYEPVAFTTSPPTGTLRNGIVLCRINSWLTGCRLVSLPFSDHCEPLCDSAEHLDFLVRYLQSSMEHQEWKYLQVRPVSDNLHQVTDGLGFRPAEIYFLHTLDLRPELGEVFQRLDKDSVQRRIQRAERAGLVEKCGRSESLLKEFYTLFVITRGRHHLPPSPYDWFLNLSNFQGEALNIRVAYKDKTPIAAILTLRFRETVYYKYGCSDVRFNKFGPTPWLFWKAIADAKANGATEFDMGRTHKDDTGLLGFKNHWVPEPRPLIYWQYPYTSRVHSIDDWKMNVAKKAFTFIPNRLLPMIGRFVYRHIG
jgi:hypothetical protein